MALVTAPTAALTRTVAVAEVGRYGSDDEFKDGRLDRGSDEICQFEILKCPPDIEGEGDFRR